MRRLTVIITTLGLAVAALATGACSGDSADRAPEPALVSAVRSGPIELRVETNRDAIRTVDRVVVLVIATLGPGASLDQLTIDAETEGWTVIEDRRSPPIAADDGRVLYERLLTLEPFLEGEYVVPTASAAWSLGDQSGVASTDPLTIPVTSVLTEGDGPALSDARALPPEPIVEAEAANPWPAMALKFGWAIVLVIGLALWLLLRRSEGDPAKAILARLERVATEQGEPSEACAEAAAALRTLSTGADAVATHRLIDQLDDARFAPAETDPDSARSLVADAVERCRTLLDQRGARA